MTMVYQGIVERAKDGSFWAYVPELPGATGSGDTAEEAQNSLEEAMKIWIADAIRDGEEIPKPSTVSAAPIAIEVA